MYQFRNGVHAKKNPYSPYGQQYLQPHFIISARSDVQTLYTTGVGEQNIKARRAGHTSVLCAFVICEVPSARITRKTINDQVPSRKIETVNNVYELPVNTTRTAASCCLPLLAVSLLESGCPAHLRFISFRPIF
jgi:hypothetical protein